MTTTNQKGSFAGKIAFVTGAGSGIGRATALAFARDGANVVVTDVSEQGNQETARLIEDRKSTRLNSSHSQISYAVFCLKKKKNQHERLPVDALNTKRSRSCDPVELFSSVAHSYIRSRRFVSSLLPTVSYDSTTGKNDIR